LGVIAALAIWYHMDSDKYPDGTWAKGYIDGWDSIAGSGPTPEILPFLRGSLTSDDQTLYETGYAAGRKAAAEK
jgi:hypothetical protein